MEGNRANDPQILGSVDISGFTANDMEFEYFENCGREDIPTPSYSEDPKSRCLVTLFGRSQWPRGLRRRSSASRLLRLWVRIPPGAWMFVCFECCVLSGRGLCYGLITRPEESYRLWPVVVCDQETSKVRKLKPATGL